MVYCESLLDGSTCNLKSFYGFRLGKRRIQGISLKTNGWLIANDHTVILYFISDLCDYKKNFLFSFFFVLALASSSDS